MRENSASPSRNAKWVRIKEKIHFTRNIHFSFVFSVWRNLSCVRYLLKDLLSVNFYGKICLKNWLFYSSQWIRRLRRSRNPRSNRNDGKNGKQTSTYKYYSITQKSISYPSFPQWNCRHFRLMAKFPKKFPQIRSVLFGVKALSESSHCRDGNRPNIIDTTDGGVNWLAKTP